MGSLERITRPAPHQCIGAGLFLLQEVIYNVRTMKKFSKVLIYVLALALFFFGGFALGKKDLKNQNENIVAVGSPDISQVWNTWKILKDKYYGELDIKKQIYGLEAGLVSSLGDPYTVFMEPKENKQFLNDLSGELEGIGAELEIKNQMLTVVAPLDNSPAEKAGLKAKDIVYKVDGEEVGKMTFSDAISKIRGKEGTPVTLTIIREGGNKPIEVKINRAKITIKSVTYNIDKNKIATIKISQFGDDTTDLLKKAAEDLAKQNLKGIIIDLRNNPGGYLDAAVDASSLFIDNGKTITWEKSKDGKEKEIKTTLDPVLKKFKTVVLINGGSASGSEIMAGSLKDYKQATLVGEKSFGKGSVQEIENLPDGSAVRVTVAKWLTPNKTMINGDGIKPDIEIKLTDEDFKNQKDPQSNKAIEIINQK